MSNDKDKRILFRISNYSDLSGTGGMLASGRWHHRGRPVVYTAETASGALLETLVHLEVDPEDMPENYQLLRIALPEDVSLIECEELPDDWYLHQEMTRELGDQWLEERRSLLLRVPSVLAPETYNVLLNPQHEEARDAEVETSIHGIDLRLLRR